MASADPLAVRNARWYFSGLAASLVGDSAMSLVAGVWVKTLTGSSAQAGFASACAYLPTMAAPLCGLLADRVRRRSLLVAVNLTAAATILALLAVRSRAEVWIVFAVMAAYGIESTIIDPAEDALFAELFTAEFRRRVNGYRLAIQETGRLLAPLLGAGLFVLVGGGAVGALDSVTFLCAALATSRLRGGTVPAPQPGRRGLVHELTAGFAQIAALPRVRTTAIAAALAMALSGVGVAAQYSLVAALGQRPAFLGVLSAVLGAGSVVASLVSGPIIAHLGERALCVLGLADLALGSVLRATASLPLALAGSFVLGFALPFVFLAVLNVAQRSTPSQLQGRVSAALTLALFGPQAPMQALGALLIGHTGYVEIYVGSAAASLAIGAWLASRA